MLERRTLLAGLAALPAARLPIAAVGAAAHADPFTRYGGEILALHAAIDACETDEASNPLMDRWGEIDAQAMADSRPRWRARSGRWSTPGASSISSTS